MADPRPEVGHLRVGEVEVAPQLVERAAVAPQQVDVRGWQVGRHETVHDREAG